MKPVTKLKNIIPNIQKEEGSVIFEQMETFKETLSFYENL